MPEDFQSFSNLDKKKSMAKMIGGRKQSVITGLVSTTAPSTSEFQAAQSGSFVARRTSGVESSTGGGGGGRQSIVSLSGSHTRKFKPGDPSTVTRPLPLQYVLKNVETRVHTSILYSDMLVYWPFLIMFLIFFFNGRNIEENHFAAAGTRAMYMNQEFISEQTGRNEMLDQLAQGTVIPELPANKKYRDIGKADDWHDYFRDTFIPFTWDCDNPGYSRSTLVKRGQMQYLGALKLRVLAMKNTSCELNPELQFPGMPQQKKACYNVHKRTGEDTDNRCLRTNPANIREDLWRYYKSSEVAGGVRTTGTNGFYHAGGYIAEIPFNATCRQALELASIIREAPCKIINDKAARFVMLEWFQYNTNTDTFLMAKFFFEITGGGSWVPNYQVRMFPVWTPKRLGMSIYDIFFFFFVLYFLFKLIFDWVSFYRRERKVLAFCFDLWNLLEVTNIATFLAVFILRWIWWTKSQNSKVEFPFGSSYPTDLDALVLLFSAQIYANAVNVVITVIKVLKYLRLNDRLNVLTRTMAICQQSIIGVLVLFIFVVLGYALSGTSLYGSTMWRFRNVNTSFSGLMFMLLGEFNYQEMRKEQPLLTGLYFFSFTVLANFLLLNFIIAILSDGFAQVSHETSLEPLDKVILRQITMLQFWLHPKNLKKILELRLKRRSRTDLLHEMGKYLQEHMDLIELHSPELLDNDLPMTKDDLRHWLPEQLHEDLGDYYIDLLWNDLEHDYSIDILSDDYQRKKDIESTIIHGVAAAVGQRLKKVNRLETAMDKIEIRVMEITGNEASATA